MTNPYGRKVIFAKQLEMEAEIYVKCSRVLTRKEKSKESVLLLSNLLDIESKKMKETIEAFLKNLFYCLSWKYTLGLNYFYTFLCVPFLFSVFPTWKKLSRCLKSIFFPKITFANFSSDFLPGINFRENRPKSRNSWKFLPAKVSAHESFCPRK